VYGVGCGVWGKKNFHSFVVSAAHGAYLENRSQESGIRPYLKKSENRYVITRVYVGTPLLIAL
jgi:hypothetical protein